MLQPLQTSITFIRNIGIARGRKVFKYPGGIRYPGFTYYPRHEDFKDPPYEPTKLFQLRRIKPLKGTPYWEKHIMKELGLSEKSSDISVVKNIPEVNAMLWRVKHLIEIIPITFPDGIPKENSLTLLKENGELEIKGVEVSQERLEALEQNKNVKTRMDGDTLRRQSRLKWLNAWN